MAQTRKPNVIVVLADDLGYSDLGVQGGKDIPTPNIDSLARMAFAAGRMSLPYCSPHRRAEHGRYRCSSGTSSMNQAPWPRFRPAAGREDHRRPVETAGLCHRGHRQVPGLSASRRPMQRGYDEFYGTLANTPFIKPTNFVDSRSRPTRSRWQSNFYDRRLRPGRVHRRAPAPALLSFCRSILPRTGPSAASTDRFPQITDESRKVYAGMLSALDDAVGHAGRWRGQPGKAP